MYRNEEAEESFRKANIAKVRENLMNTSLGILETIDCLDKGDLETSAESLDSLLAAARYSSMALKALAKMDAE